MLKNYFKEQSGNVSVIAGLTMLPILIGVGVATDAGFAMKKRQMLQDAIDVAALSAIHEPNRNNANKTFIESLKSKGYDTEEGIQIRSFKREQSRGNVTVQATVSGAHKLAFGSILGRSQANYSVETSVTGQNKLSAIRFTPTYGSGYLNKEFQLWVIRPYTTVPERLATYRWTSSAAFTFPNGSSPGWINSTSTGPIDLGNYTDFFMTTTITDPWNTYSREAMVEVYGEDFTISSIEPGHGDHFFVNGRQLDAEEMVNFTRDYSCEQTMQNFEWEDAPGFAQPNTDFRFTVQATCDDVDPDTIRIDK
jgi:Flp pilus assembly protein TadG